ncbi:hypothetical protein LTR16_008713, partial [Cryomyces antarcticus]
SVTTTYKLHAIAQHTFQTTPIANRAPVRPENGAARLRAHRRTSGSDSDRDGEPMRKGLGSDLHVTRLCMALEGGGHGWWFRGRADSNGQRPATPPLPPARRLESGSRHVPRGLAR